MRKLLALLLIVVVGYVLWAIFFGEEPSRMTSSPQPTATSPAPTVDAPPSTPASSSGRTATSPTHPPPPGPPSGVVDQRSLEVRRVIEEAARRAGWRLVRYQQPQYGVSRVTGWAPSGDHVRSQRFLDELQNSGIIQDINLEGGRPVTSRDGRAWLESTITIRWR